MKKAFFALGFILIARLLPAQSFFYIDNNRITDKLLTDALSGASQFVAKSPMGSDYTIKSNVGFETATHVLTLSIALQDSITNQTIFQSNEEYKFRASANDTPLVLNMAIRTFIEKNINQIVMTARDDHFGSQMKCLKPKKDKT
jgi:hypothetical protein